MHGELQALVSPWAQPGVDFMHVGDGGEIEEDGRIEVGGGLIDPQLPKTKKS